MLQLTDGHCLLLETLCGKILRSCEPLPEEVLSRQNELRRLERYIRVSFPGKKFRGLVVFPGFYRVIFNVHTEHSYCLQGQCHVAVNKPVISRIYIVAHTWSLYSAQILVDRVNPH